MNEKEIEKCRAAYEQWYSEHAQHFPIEYIWIAAWEKALECKNKKTNQKPAELDNAVFYIPTNRFNTINESFGVTNEMIMEWSDAYGSVDIYQELSKIKAWSFSNESKRKTMRGMKRFINSWLSRAHDKGGSYNQAQSNTKNLTVSDQLSDRGWAYGK